jgi:hypothetical protein
MDDVGFQGTGSRFNTRFGSGEDIYASQLNGLATGIQSALGMPYLGAGQSVSFVPGGNIITGPSPVENAIGAAINITLGLKYVNHYEIQVGTMFLDSVLIPTPTLKVAKGGNIWRPANSECVSELRADTIMTDGTITVVPGADPTSPWASNDGYIVITPGTVYYVYAFKLETAVATAFYIYVSTDGTLTSACPCPMPGGFSPPDIPYNFQGILLGTATYTLPFFPVVDQKVVGSITWPNLPSPTVAEYVNHWEAKYEVIQIEGVDTDIVRIGRGGNVWNPSTTSDGNAHEKRADVIVSDGSVSVVTGTDTNSPWASDNGYILPYGGVNTYIYAFKVTYNNGNTSDFHIYAATSDTLLPAAGGEVVLPAGLLPAPAPAGQYTVQGLRVADIVWNGATEAPHFYINQRVVGSITWPDYVPPYVPRQLEVKVTQDGDVYKLQIAKGGILWKNSKMPNASDGYQLYAPPLQGYAEKVWVYPAGTLSSGDNSNSPWVNSGGWVSLEDTTKIYNVYIIGNNAGGPSQYGNVALAVIADGSDADDKSRPFKSDASMGREWFTLFVDLPIATVDSSDIVVPYLWSNLLFNHNCMRYRVAKVYFNETAWVVDQYLLGPVTLPDDLTFCGSKAYPPVEPGTPWVVAFGDKQEDWQGSWSGYTKDGDPEYCTRIVSNYPGMPFYPP